MKIVDNTKKNIRKRRKRKKLVINHNIIENHKTSR